MQLLRRGFHPYRRVKIAQGFYLPAKNIAANDQVAEGLEWALDQVKKGGPAFLNVEIQPIEEYVPPVCQWEKDIQLPKSSEKN